MQSVMEEETCREMHADGDCLRVVLKKLIVSWVVYIRLKQIISDICSVQEQRVRGALFVKLKHTTLLNRYSKINVETCTERRIEIETTMQRLLPNVWDWSTPQFSRCRTCVKVWFIELSYKDKNKEEEAWIYTAIKLWKTQNIFEENVGLSPEHPETFATDFFRFLIHRIKVSKTKG